MRTPAFEFLRVKEQLGYDVDVVTHTHCGVCGVSLMVSGGASAAVPATWKVEEFLEGFGEHLANMTKQDFAEVRDSTYGDFVRTLQPSPVLVPVCPHHLRLMHDHMA
jgi:secreted Zn-dependent insulinase-like peptidase